MAESPKIITSAQNPAVKRLRSLAVKKYRDEEGLFLVEGARHVGEALDAGWTLEVLVHAADKSDDPVTVAARAARATCLEVTNDILSRISGRDNPQPVIGAFRQRWHALEEVREGLWVGLEGIRDPGNLGTIMRTADAVKADGVILIGETCDPWSPEAVRATMGSLARMKIVKAALPQFLSWRGQWRGSLVGTHLQTDTDYRRADYRLPLVLLMGGEQSGLSDKAAKACDILVRIPMAGGAESLNLAVSTGIMLYEISRGRL